MCGLYIVLFLHQTTTSYRCWCWSAWLYIVLFLHQTTTYSWFCFVGSCCISYYSYIKPQLPLLLTNFSRVVYRTIPTSNHNASLDYSDLQKLYIVLFLHQTTTTLTLLLIFRKLYIVLFLHQTTTRSPYAILLWCCISYYSYIKPQLWHCVSIVPWCCISYYSYIKPQLCLSIDIYHTVVYRTIPTSNHNYLQRRVNVILVVYRTIPTSNHNKRLLLPF